MSEKLDPKILVEVRKDIYKIEKALSDLYTKESNIASKYDESVATSLSSHAIIEFCKRIRPEGFDMDALEILIFEYFSKASLVKTRNGQDGCNEYFYEYTIGESTIVFLVKDSKLVTIWKKDAAEA